MAKKAELYAELKKLDKKTTLTDKNTIAEIQAAIEKLEAGSEKVEVVTEDKDASLDSGSVVGMTGDDKKDEGQIKYAKSGKKSLKHELEVKEKEEKEARKVAHDTTAQGETPAVEKKGEAPKTRTILERKGKAYRKVIDKIEKGKTYSVTDAVKLATETCPAKFDTTVEVHVRLGVDPKQADQNIRSTIVLPNGSGKTVKVAAFVADGEDAKKAGADVAGEAEILAMLDKENIDFDVLVTTPQLMPKLGKYARLLGPKGLMPNPKAGTVSTNPNKAIKEAKSGKVEYRVDKQGIVHLGVGKVSFGTEKILQNVNAFFESLNANKPASLKGNYILSIYITTTMGPSIKVSL